MSGRVDDSGAIVEVVCTGNICRSPYAEALLRAAAADRLEVPSLVTIRSCGTSGLDGHAATKGTIEEARRRGLDLSGHAGARWTEERILAADLVLVMAEQHRTHLVDRIEVAARTFTIRELVRLVAQLEPIDEPIGVRQRIQHVAAAAHRLRPLLARPSEPEDIADPYGGPPEGYVRMAAQLDRLVLALADRLFGPLPDSGEGLFDRPK